MKYETIKQGIFIERPNRFIARVLFNEKAETVHVKNTGRCREILIPGVKVILEKAKHKERKTAYSLIAAYKGVTLINIDSQAPNQVVYEALQQGLLPQFGNLTRLLREVRFGNSRFDIYYENESESGFIEVKGVTLERDGMALFPDAPTERGAKHLLELAEAVKSGFKAHVFFLIQMKGPDRFQPNTIMDPKFTESLQLARNGGVEILAYDTVVREDSLIMGEPVEVDGF
ncbi:MAG: DNA/RNA nuclease SfsA [Firmicutes bacterium]|nr:DNA/RNA nuclease SfsA [Bacillota bacterium]